MKLDEYFTSLCNGLERIDSEWKTADTQRRLLLAGELKEHREISDQIVDQWIQYEEKLSTLIKKVKLSGNNHTFDPSNKATNPTQDEKSITNTGSAPIFAKGKDSSDELEIHEHLFRKGEGFYHLRLFEDSRNYFSKLLTENPDWEHGRLYYAYSMYFNDEKEAALREFRLLSKTASSPKVSAISYNAIGCILAEEKHYLEAAQSFESAREVMPSHAESLFNLALCHFQQGEAHEAIEKLDEYLEENETDWEAFVLWIRIASLLRQQDSSLQLNPPIQIQVPDRNTDQQLLREMATMYEANGQIHLAMLCYRYLVDQNPRQAWAWHGHGWNTWLIEGEHKAIPLVKKAIALAPQNNDFLFSYGWMHLCGGHIERAREIFRFVILRNRRHILSLSGLVTIYCCEGEYTEAKRLASSFLDEQDPYVQSLGYYHLGKIAVKEESWKVAKHYFKKVLYDTGHYGEVPQYLKLCNAKLGLSSPVLEEKTDRIHI
ncbi:tetratricopeptide repeat protein [Brevibacillus sp. SYSU BS000544]|uniref:tetratricopeptide repeat protein n=1 Tax=Brevibacillus sp. SYSU BS000544 TaxID=3416443 RepID=UPI003CE4842D